MSAISVLCAVLLALGPAGSCSSNDSDGGASCCSGGSTTKQAASRSAGNSGKKVVLYCSVDQEVAEPIIAEFQKQTGVKVLTRFDTEASKTVQLAAKIRAEAASPAADVFWAGEVFHVIRLAQDGLLASGTPPEKWNEQYTDRQGRWHGFALRARAIAYSTKRVQESEAPRRLEDLLDARWSGRIVMAAPRAGTTGGDVASWFDHYGPDKAKEILQGLKANKVRLVDGNSTAVRMVATGQADIALTDTDDVYAGRRNNWPIGMSYIDQGGEGVLTFPMTAALIQGGPHPAEARLLLDFLLSERVERLLAESDMHTTPVRPALAAQFPQYAIPKALGIPYEKIAEQLPRAIQAASDILTK